MEQQKNPYEVLGIEKSAEAKEIKSAYRKLAKQWHPDVNDGSTQAEERFKEIQNAYAILSDPGKRSQYDRTGDATGRRSSSHEDFTGFDAHGFWREAGRPIIMNANIATFIEVGLQECLGPITRIIQFDRPVPCKVCKGSGGAVGAEIHVCSDCGGGGVRTNKTQTPFGSAIHQAQCVSCHGRGQRPVSVCGECQGIGIKIEQVSQEIVIPLGGAGRRMAFVGLGGTAVPHQKPGALLVDVLIKPHPIFRLGDDGSITYRLRIDPVSAILGDEVQVPTLDGEEINLKLNPKSAHGSVYTVNKRGLPVGAQERAPMRVEVFYELPVKVTDEMQDALMAYLKAKRGSTTQGSAVNADQEIKK